MPDGSSVALGDRVKLKTLCVPEVEQSPERTLQWL
jgi:hypothetical protein